PHYLTKTNRIWSQHGEANLSPAQQAPDSHARLSCANGHALGPRGPEPPTEEGTAAVDRSASIQVRWRLMPRAFREATGSRGQQRFVLCHVTGSAYGQSTSRSGGSLPF